jgi:polyisoprenoid-binding protein YceI
MDRDKQEVVRAERWFWGIVCGGIMTVLLPQSVKATQYLIDSSRSELVVQLFKTGLGAALAHDHVVRATKYRGHIEVDLAAPTAAQITVEIDAAALVADESEIRQKYALPLGLSEENRRDIQRALEAENQLAVTRYPTIRFRSTRIIQTGEGQYLVTGELELRGVTHAITLSLQVEWRGDEFHGQGTSRFRQSSFGYHPYSAFWGAVQNQDEVLLHVDIVALRQ